MQTKNDDISKIDQAKVGLKVFFSAVTEWELSADDARALLGNPSRSRYYEYKAGTVRFVSDDFLFRLAYLCTIYGNLRLLYTHNNTKLWLKNGSKPGSKWSGLSPLKYMISNIRGVIAVFDHLNAYIGNDTLLKKADARKLSK